MQEVLKLLIGIIILLLGYPLGGYLAKETKEELKSGQKYFKIIILVSLFSCVVGLFLRDDVLFFTSVFIGLVTSRSLKR